VVLLSVLIPVVAFGCLLGARLLSHHLRRPQGRGRGVTGSGLEAMGRATARAASSAGGRRDREAA